jgi:hypothetical protein
MNEKQKKKKKKGRTKTVQLIEISPFFSRNIE